jgi:hypothetical protein
MCVHLFITRITEVCQGDGTSFLPSCNLRGQEQAACIRGDIYRRSGHNPSKAVSAISARMTCELPLNLLLPLLDKSGTLRRIHDARCGMQAPKENRPGSPNSPGTVARATPVIPTSLVATCFAARTGSPVTRSLRLTAHWTIFWDRLSGGTFDHFEWYSSALAPTSLCSPKRGGHSASV